jgi:two-component system LytT family response regulator
MQDFLFVKDGRQIFQVFFSELLFLESATRYVRFVTTDRSYLQEGSLCKAEEELPGYMFCRIHRNYIISLRYARHLNSKVVSVAGRELPVGKSFRGILWSKIITKKEEGIIAKQIANNIISISL